MDGRTFVTWSDGHEQLAEEVVRKYAARMGELGIATRHGKKINRSGAVLIALMIAAGQLPQHDQDKDEKGA